MKDTQRDEIMRSIWDAFERGTDYRSVVKTLQQELPDEYGCMLTSGDGQMDWCNHGNCPRLIIEREKKEGGLLFDIDYVLGEKNQYVFYQEYNHHGPGRPERHVGIQHEYGEFSYADMMRDERYTNMTEAQAWGWLKVKTLQLVRTYGVPVLDKWRYAKRNRKTARKMYRNLRKAGDIREWIGQMEAIRDGGHTWAVSEDGRECLALCMDRVGDLHVYTYSTEVGGKPDHVLTVQTQKSAEMVGYTFARPGDDYKLRCLEAPAGTDAVIYEAKVNGSVTFEALQAALGRMLRERYMPWWARWWYGLSA